MYREEYSIEVTGLGIVEVKWQTGRLSIYNLESALTALENIKSRRHEYATEEAWRRNVEYYEDIVDAVRNSA